MFFNCSQGIYRGKVDAITYFVYALDDVLITGVAFIEAKLYIRGILFILFWRKKHPIDISW